jgi:phosphatidylglycerophosphate synthase
MTSTVRLWIDTSAIARAQNLFGIAPLERLRRSAGSLAKEASVTLSGPPVGDEGWPRAEREVSEEPVGIRLRRALSNAGSLVVIDGATVVDPRLIAFLSEKAAQPCVAMRGEGAGRAVAFRLDAASARAIPPDAGSLAAVADALLAAGLIAPLDEQAFPAYMDKLRRSLPYWLYRVDDETARRTLERKMFWDNYKGSTDLLTSHVYPPLVWPLVRACVRLNIHPNTVTVLSIVLAFVAVPLFAKAHWVAAFLCAYTMSVLDSVDGKLARLTLTDSRIGNVLDHGLDQVHPPFWYYAWAWGLGGRSVGDPVLETGILLIVFYFADRIVLGIGKARLGHALHASSRLDERVRAIIARRNITMTIMAIALLMGEGVKGLYLVTAWQALTFAWHTWRTLWLGFLRPRRRPTEA